jgi:RND family efflux transporter MFP subunit
MPNREGKAKSPRRYSPFLSYRYAQCHDTPSARGGCVFLLAALSLAISSAEAASYDCLIEPTQTVELASPVTGMLDQVFVKRGDRVAKGQVVATLESRAERAAADLARFKSEQKGPVQAAESKIEFSKRKFDRRQSMSSEKLIAVQERDDAEADYRLAQSELIVAKENQQIAALEFQQQSSLLALRTIKSPVDGVVVDQGAFPGEVVEPGSNKKTVLKVAQLDPLRVHVILPKDAFGKVAAGMVVDVSPEIPLRKPYIAKVKSVDRLVDAASGTFVVFLEMPNAKLDIPAGVKCKAAFRSWQPGLGR